MLKFSMIIKLFLSLICIISLKCRSTTTSDYGEPIYIEPDYQQMKLETTGDTVTISLKDSAATPFQNFNCFNYRGLTYLSLFERKSNTVIILNFSSGLIVKQLSLQALLIKQKTFNPSVFVVNFDSILVSNNKFLYIVDSSGVEKNSFELNNDDFPTWANLNNEAPPIFKNGAIYVKAYCQLGRNSLPEIKKWRILHHITTDKKDTLRLALPKCYTSNIYGYYFYNYSYTINKNNRFVFSFPADPNIYVTNLTSHYSSFFGRSKFQNDEIAPLAKEEIINENRMETFTRTDAYGPIYFDQFARQYLRIFKPGVKDNKNSHKRGTQTQSVIIFDENFRIIGESELNNSIELGTLFFSADGHMYAKIKNDNPNFLQFVRIAYRDANSEVRIVSQPNKPANT